MLRSSSPSRCFKDYGCTTSVFLTTNLKAVKHAITSESPRLRTSPTERFASRSSCRLIERSGICSATCSWISPRRSPNPTTFRCGPVVPQQTAPTSRQEVKEPGNLPMPMWGMLGQLMKMDGPLIAPLTKPDGAYSPMCWATSSSLNQPELTKPRPRALRLTRWGQPTKTIQEHGCLEPCLLRPQRLTQRGSTLYSASHPPVW